MQYVIISIVVIVFVLEEFYFNCFIEYPELFLIKALLVLVVYMLTKIYYYLKNQAKE